MSYLPLRQPSESELVCRTGGYIGDTCRIPAGAKYIFTLTPWLNGLRSTTWRLIARKQRKWFLDHLARSQRCHSSTGNLVQQVTQYKLLGVTINAALKWDDHVNAITSKAAKRIWFLKKLKQAGVVKDYLVCFFQTAVRPILEYACPAWHTSLTKNSRGCSRMSSDMLSRSLSATSRSKKLVVWLAYASWTTS